jgi:hypothetical protein
MGWIHLRDVVWVESYANNAPINSANGSVIDINWQDKTVMVSFGHSTGEEIKYFDFDELQGTFSQGYKCFMVFDVPD